MLKRSFLHKINFFVIMLIVMVGGCAYHKVFVTPDDMVQFPGDERVWYEEGAYAKAKIIAGNLDEQINRIEKAQYRPFKQLIRIYVFSSLESFERYAVVSKSGGETHGNKILISPKKANTDSRLPGIVEHELSHYHMFGYLGVYKSRITPRWFLEGLAVWESGGAGAERVSREDAIEAILAGNTLKAVTRHPLLFGDKSQPSAMKPHMFYRQSALFVEYLHDLNPNNFKLLLLGVEDGDSFANLFETVYGKMPIIMWGQFVNTLKHNQASNQVLGDAVPVSVS
jgi:hypothetical protein